jgi:nucleoporin SEH1
MEELDILSSSDTASASLPSVGAPLTGGNGVQQAKNTGGPSSSTGMGNTGNQGEAHSPFLDAHYALSWCPSKFFPTSIAVSTGKEYSVKLFRLDSHNKWAPMETLKGHSDLVTDVAWAPNLGRSFELIATSSRDGHVRIYKLKEELSKPSSLLGDTSSSSTSNALVGSKKRQALYKVECVADLKDHEAPVWRLNWNITVLEFF